MSVVDFQHLRVFLENYTDIGRAAWQQPLKRLEK